MTHLRPFDRSLPMALLSARESVMAKFRPLLAENGLTEQQWRVLRAVAAGTSLDASAVAERTNLLAPSVTRILARLSELDLIVRTLSSSDHRRSLIELSDYGQEFFDKIAPQSEAIYAEIEETFGSDRLDQLLLELAALEST